MRMMHLSDLHIGAAPRPNALNSCSPVVPRVKKHVAEEKPDVVVISGDIFEYDVPMESRIFTLKHMFGDIPTVFCLGNHEFFYRNVPDALDMQYAYDKVPGLYCLDTCGHVDISGVRFVGNVLWYDGKHKLPGQVMEEWADGCWADRLIEDHASSWWLFNAACIKQITDNIGNSDKKKVLVTHCVPHSDLNAFNKQKPSSDFNAYSSTDIIGKDDALYDVFDYALCGHTHNPVRMQIGKTQCYCSRQDYFRYTGVVEYDIIELLDASRE